MLNCQFCNKEVKSNNSKAQNELYCKSNPDPNRRKVVPSYGMLGKKGSNQHIKGTAKPLSEQAKEAIRNSNKNRIWDEKARAKQSASMKRAVENHPESYTSSNRGRTKQIIFDGIKFQGRWELDFYKWCKDNNIYCVRNTQGFKYLWNGERTYYPDFYLPEKNVYIEVKGYKTERDDAKWSQFPKKLLTIQKQDILNINKNTYTLPL